MPDAPTIVGGRYRLGRLLAASGMADVYVATDERLERPVALKFLRAAGPTDHERFRREMATVARLEHPNLVRLYDADVQDATPYLVLELVDGPSLAEHLATDGPLDGERTARLLSDVASALAYVHEHDVVHRDVKPSNVLLDPDGRARLTDFGIARAGDATAMTGTAMTIGTAAYLAPEQAAGAAVTSAADVYALGLVVLECLTGERAFPGPPVEAAVARLSRDPEVPATLGAEWCELLARMTARDPDARPSAASIAADESGTTEGAAGVADGTSTVPMDVAGVGVAGGAATVPMGAADAGIVAMGEGPTATKLLPSAASDAPEQPRRRPWRVGALLALVAAIVLVAIGLASGFGSDDPPVDAQSGGSTVPTSLATTTTPPTTGAPTTAAPTTAPAAVAAASSCTTLEARRRALDDKKKALGGGKGADKATQDAARRALDDAKKQLDAEQKACRA